MQAALRTARTGRLRPTLGIPFGRIMKMNKILVATLLCTPIVLVSIIYSWIRNPYGLEKERLGPKSSNLSALVRAVPNAQNFLLHTYPDESEYVIHIALPNNYIHKSHETKRIIDSYSLSAYMYYPGLNGKFHPENKNLPKCNGYCGGYVSAYIKPSNESANTISSKKLERLYRDRKQGNPLMKFDDLSPEFGIEDHFQIRYPVSEEKSKGKKYSTEEYLIKRSNSGNVKYVFECSPYTPSPACSVKFNLTTRPELLVDIQFGRHLMAQWENVVNSTNEKIASWEPARIEVAK